MNTLLRATFRPALLLAAFLARGIFVGAAEPAISGPTVNVKDFGAKGDCQRVADGSMAIGSPVLTSASAQFSPSDLGKPIYVLGANTEKVADLGDVAGSPLSSRIVAVTDAHTITLADPARQAVSGVSVTWGADDTQSIQRAIDSLNGTGGTVFVPEGTYRVVYQGGPGLKIAASNIRFHGVGNKSAIFNSTVIFRAKQKEGVTYVEQKGVPVLYAGRPGVAVENVEVDHLWLGDNGQQYDFKIWGPNGPGVLGSAGQIDRFSFHDVTIETKFLCGVNMDSQTNGFSICRVDVLSSGEHGFYLAGTASGGDVRDNRIVGTTAPMRQGLVLKKKSHMRVTRNEIANVEFQGIGVEGDDPSYISRDILIADNWLHDLSAWHTDAITIFNAEDVVIRGNRITDTSWIAINLHTWMYTVSKVLVQDNILTHTGSPDPKDRCYAIVARYDPPPKLAPGASWPGVVRDIIIEGNVITDSGRGISVKNVAGTNLIQGNRVENREAQESAVGYNLDLMPESTLAFTKNRSLHCPHNPISPKIENADNDLQ